MKIIVIGGGWAGCAAALSACKQGAEVILVERTDMLLGTGLVGGIMRNNGRFTAAEEMLAMSGGELFQLTDKNSLHRGIDFPGHRHASLYNVGTMEPIIKNFLSRAGVQVQLSSRITDVEMGNHGLKAVVGKCDKEELRFSADAFVDTTGTAGPPSNCTKHGNGCVMCVLRCHSFGGRVSPSAKAGVQEIIGKKGAQAGAMSGSCKLLKESLAKDIVDRLNREGVVVIPLAEANRMTGKLSIKACQQYAIPEFETNIVLLNTGHAKLMTPYFPLEALRQIPGFEYARFEDPYAGGKGNSIRYFGMAPRNDALQVKGVDNLFCAGEKAGLLVGHTEAICTGTLAGYNAARFIRKESPLVIPDNLVVGDAISYVRSRMKTSEGLGLKYTFSGSVFLDRMLERKLYSTDVSQITGRVESAGLAGVFSGP